MFAAATGIESQNIVGYQTSGLRKGGTMVTAQFINAGTTQEMPLQSLVPVGDDVADNVQIQTLDAFGRTVDSYDWNDWVSDKPCWVDGDYSPVENVTFDPGQGLWVMGSAASQSLQSSGQVGKSDVQVKLRKGGTLGGNPFPVKIDLLDIVAEGENAPDNVQIQTLDAFGRTVDSYDWNDWVSDKPCWVDGDYNPVTEVTVDPGQGLWIMGSSTDQSVTFPAPEL